MTIDRIHEIVQLDLHLSKPCAIIMEEVQNDDYKGDGMINS